MTLDSKWNHSRNFTGKWLNAFLFNNGFHFAHHWKPMAHWSELPALHAQVQHLIHPELQFKNVWAHLVRQYVIGAFIENPPRTSPGTSARRDAKGPAGSRVGAGTAAGSPVTISRVSWVPPRPSYGGQSQRSSRPPERPLALSGGRCRAARFRPCKTGCIHPPCSRPASIAGASVAPSS